MWRGFNDSIQDNRKRLFLCKVRQKVKRTNRIMIKLFTCTIDTMKRHIASEKNNSYWKIHKGWIGAKKISKHLVTVYHYVKFPKKTYDSLEYVIKL